jgi:hypothetical protein
MEVLDRLQYQNLQGTVETVPRKRPIDDLVSVARGRVLSEAVSDGVEFVGNLVRETAHGHERSKSNQGSNQSILNEVLTGFLIYKGPQ